MTKYELFNKLGIEPSSIKKIGKVTIINNKYVIKKMIRNSDFYDYLLTRNFNYFPKIYSNINDEIELMDYINETDIPDEQKLEDLTYLVSILHLNTQFDKNIDLDKIKEIYETTIDKLNELLTYYQKTQDIIEEEIYMSPANYLLIRNISLIYKAISLAKEYIDKWYKEIENIKSVRYAYIHGNLRKEHLLENDKLYLISWDNSTIDLPIKDLNTFYKNSYRDIKLIDMLNIYEKKNLLKKEEKYYLFSMLLMPKKIEFSDDEYLKTKQVRELIDYTETILEELENYSKKTNNNTNK